MELSESQKRALIIYENKEHVLLLGPGGTGKSYLITNYFRSSSVITAMTGVAAFSIRGITLHSFLGIGTGKQDIAFLLRRLRKNRNAVKRIRTTSSLVIDEISMMSASLFEKIDHLCKEIRKCYHKPFGGIRIILSGDFFQLLPIFTEKDSDTRLLFESTLFQSIFTPQNTILLDYNFRQNDKGSFHQMLMRIRTGVFTKDDIHSITQLLSQSQEDGGGVYLVSSKQRANEINYGCMNELQTDEKIFDAVYETSGNDENTKKWLEEELWTQMEQRDLNRVVIKQGCRVMLVVNLDVETGLVNGRTGEVIGFVDTNYPRVQFGNTVVVITPTNISLEHDDSICAVTFLPLILSYAITIHKSQSLTLDSAIMELGGCFAEHMVYVALSRVRKMENVHLKSFYASKIRVNPKVKLFIDTLLSDTHL